jgi:N-acetylglucosamine kinase-like BadF-type ATPase
MKWVMGVDGGGIRTIGCAVDENGKILGSIEKGPANHHIIGIENFRKLIQEMLVEFDEIHGLKLEDLLFVSMGLAGVDRPIDKTLIASALIEVGLAGKYMVSNESEIALGTEMDK